MGEGHNKINIRQSICNARCATDITGFGLVGHLLEVAEASKVGIELQFERIPFLEGAREALQAGFTCGGAQANERHAGPRLSMNRDMSEPEIGLLADPQTAGPLVFTVKAELGARLVEQLHALGYRDAALGGLITDEHCGVIQVS